MPRNWGPRGEYEKRHTCLCVWCDERFESAHDDAQTCSGRCRSRLARYRLATGLTPQYPPGNVTTKVAFERLIEELLAGERERRAMVEAENKAAAELMVKKIPRNWR